MSHDKKQTLTSSGRRPFNLGCTEARHEAFEAARLHWPDIRLSFEQFEQHLERTQRNIIDWNHVSSLYLCAGCALGLNSACRTLEQKYFRSLRTPIWRIVRDHDAIDDVLQKVRTRLLLGSPAKVVSYRGWGSISAWLQVIAVRAALDHLRAESSRRERAKRLERELVCSPESLPTACPLERTFDSKHSRTCERALEEALAAVRSEDRYLLFDYFLGGLGIDRLSEVYAIDRSTAARRIRKIVLRIRMSVCAGVAADFPGLAQPELSEIAAAVREHVSVDPDWLQQYSAQRSRPSGLPERSTVAQMRHHAA
jgi:RNA polymerase sigma-70 factor